MTKPADTMRINSAQELEFSVHNKQASHLLLTHENITVGEHDLRLMQTALTQLPPNSAVIARIFDDHNPYWMANAGYWQDSDLLRWHVLSMAEQVDEINEPLLAKPFQTSLGAVLISRDTAQHVGFFDSRFQTSLCDLEWLQRAKRLGVTCALVRNARIFAKNEPSEPGRPDVYGITRDGLLLESAMGWLWPLRLFRQFTYVIRDIWRPFDFHLNRDHALLRRWVWAISNYMHGLHSRITCQESRDMLRAMRDFIWLIAFPRTRQKR